RLTDDCADNGAASRAHEAEYRGGCAGDVAERFHRERVEVRTDPAELKHRDCEQDDEERERQVRWPGKRQQQPERVDGKETEQRAMRKSPHAEPADEPRIDEGR